MPYACFSSNFKVSSPDCINILVQDDENCVITRNPPVSKVCSYAWNICILKKNSCQLLLF